MIKNVIILAALALFPVFAQASQPTGTVYSPHKSVLCDKKAGLCADERGIAMGLTKESLGAVAEARFTQHVRENPGMDLKAYVLSNGADCDSTKRTCMAERRGTEVDWRYTRHLFGG